MFLDSTILIELARRGWDDPFAQKVREFVGGEPAFCSAIQLGEVADHARRIGGLPAEWVSRTREAVEIVPVDEESAVEASEIKAEARRSKEGRHFSLIDGVILASARRRGQRLLTTAKEFSGFADATIVDAAT